MKGLSGLSEPASTPARRAGLMTSVLVRMAFSVLVSGARLLESKGDDPNGSVASLGTLSFHLDLLSLFVSLMHVTERRR